MYRFTGKLRFDVANYITVTNITRYLNNYVYLMSFCTNVVITIDYPSKNVTYLLTLDLLALCSCAANIMEYLKSKLLGEFFGAKTQTNSTITM